MTVMKNLNEKFAHFRYKEHSGDLFRGISYERKIIDIIAY